MRDSRSISPALLAQRSAPREVTLPLYLQLPGALDAPRQAETMVTYEAAEADFGAEAGGLTIRFDADDDFY